jgi:ATP-dependent HslUV protease subunit HslV
MAHSQLSAPEVVKRSLEIAGDICIYTNRNIDVVEVPA